MAARRAPQPAPASSSFNQGFSTFMQCFKPRAAKMFTEHLKCNPNHFESWLFRGICYSIMGERQNAVSDFANAEKHGTPCEKLIAQGYRTGNPECFKKATVTYPNEGIGWHFYGERRYFSQIIDDETKSALLKAIQLKYARAAISHFLLGCIFKAKNELSDSTDHFRKCVELIPNCTVGQIGLGQCLLEKGCHAEAKACFIKATELNVTQLEANAGLVRLYVIEQNYDEALYHAAVYIGNRIELAHKPSSGTQKENPVGTGRGNKGGNGGGSSDDSDSDESHDIQMKLAHKPSSGTRKENPVGTGSGGNKGGNGGGSSDDSDSDESHDVDDDGNDDVDSESWLEKRYRTFFKLKNEITEEAQYKDCKLYCIMIKKRKFWFSFDKARHGHVEKSAFKVWRQTKSRLVFDSSYDVNFERMENKHESNQGREIMLSDLKKRREFRKK